MIHEIPKCYSFFAEVLGKAEVEVQVQAASIEGFPRFETILERAMLLKESRQR